MNETAKQTAGNNRFLAGVKRMMNAKVYAKTMRILNAEGQGAALAYLNQFFNRPVTVAEMEDFRGWGR